MWTKWLDPPGEPCPFVRGVRLPSVERIRADPAVRGPLLEPAHDGVEEEPVAGFGVVEGVVDAAGFLAADGAVNDEVNHIIIA